MWPNNQNSNNRLPLWQQYLNERLQAQQAQSGEADRIAQYDKKLRSETEKLCAPLNLDEWCPKLQAGDKGAAEKTVYLASKKLEDSEIIRICQAAQNNPHVKVMNFFKTQLNDQGVTAIGQFMSKTRSLTHIDVSHTGINPHGALRLCFMLKMCPTLQVVNMFGLPIGDAAASCLADALRQKSDLNHLNLCQTNIGNNGVKMILDALTACPRPFYLALERTKLSPENIARLSNTPQLMWKDDYKESSELFSQLANSCEQVTKMMSALLNNDLVNNIMNPFFGN